MKTQSATAAVKLQRLLQSGIISPFLFYVPFANLHCLSPVEAIRGSWAIQASEDVLAEAAVAPRPGSEFGPGKPKPGGSQIREKFFSTLGG